MCIDDPASSIGGRLKCLYDTDYFNLKLNDELGMTVSDLSKYFFYFYTIAQKGGFILDDFQKIIKDEDREKMKKLLAVISSSVRSKKTTFSQVGVKIENILSTDEVRRGKPFLKIDGRHFCIDPHLLVDTLCDFPYHFLLERFGGDKKKKDELSDVKGKAFESYLSLVANRATGENTWEPLLYTKPKDLKGREYCDLFHNNIL